MASRLSIFSRVALAGFRRAGRVARPIRVPQLRPYSLSMPRLQQQQQQQQQQEQQHQHEEKQQNQEQEQQQAGGGSSKKPWTPRDYARLAAWLAVLGGVPAYVVYKGGEYWIELAEDWEDEVEAFYEAEREKLPQSPITAFVIKFIKRPFKWLVLNYVKEDMDDLMAAAVPDPHGRLPRTLVLNFEDTIAHPFWSRTELWRVRKRPHLKEMIDRVRNMGWELVVWSSKSQMEVDGNLQACEIPLHNMFFREAAKGRLFGSVKDLSRLGRDLKRVVMVDVRDNIVKQKENTLIVPKFRDNKADKELLRLAEFCEGIQKYNIRDVRPYIAKYNEGLEVKKIFEKEHMLSSQASQAKGRGALIGKVGGLMNKKPGASTGGQPAAA